MSAVSHNEFYENMRYEELREELFVLTAIHSSEQIKDLLDMFLRAKMTEYLKQ